MQSIVFRVVAFAASVLALASASPAAAGVIFSVPPPSVTLDTAAQYDTETATGGPVSSVGPEAGAPELFTDQATALAAAGAPGSLQSFSQAGGAGGVPDVEASSTVTQVSNWVATGITAGLPVDLDLTLSLDGSLETFSSGALATVSFVVDVITESGGPQNVFDVGAELTDVLTVTGDWAVGDFSCVGTACSVDFSLTLDDALLISAGEVFAIEAELATEAITPGAFEIIALADFFNTAQISLGTSTPDVSFASLPEPTTGALFAAGAALLMGLRRKADR